MKRAGDLSGGLVKLGIMGVVGSMPVLACSLIVYIRINLVSIQTSAIFE